MRRHRRGPRVPRKQPKQARSRETVEVILEATARVLVKEGYSRATTNRIANVAGVSIGSLYQFFPNKESLFTALRQRHYDALTSMISGAAGALRGVLPRDALRAGIKLNIAIHGLDPELHRALDEEVPALEVERNRTIERLGYEATLDLLREHRSELRPRNLELAAFLVTHTVEALTHAAVVHFPELLRDDRFVEEVTELLWRYLRRDENRPRTSRVAARVRKRDAASASG